MSGLIIPGVPVADRRRSRVLQAPLAAAREGIMIHYDDSSRDDWALAWFEDPSCKNGYTWLVLDDGSVVELADPGMRTPHAGACRTPMANSRYVAISAATNGLVVTTAAQMDAIVTVCAAVFAYYGWEPGSAGRRIVGHDAEAIWTPEATRAAGIDDLRGRPLWNRLGRKVDPTGVRRDSQAIIDVQVVRDRLVQRQ